MKSTIGTTIYKIRKRQGISQKKLCWGLCSSSTLSKYEAGESVPDRLVLDALLQRLGKSPDYFATVQTLEEYRYLVWKQKISQALNQDKWNLVEQLLLQDEMQNRKCNRILQEQFSRYVQGLWMEHQNQDGSSEVLAAIQMTVPWEDRQFRADVVISTSELNMIVVYGIMIAKKGQDRECFSLLKKVICYIERFVESEGEFLKVYSRAICAMEKCVQDEECHEEWILRCRKAFQLLKKNGIYENLAEIMMYLIRDLNGRKDIEALQLEQQLQALLSLYQEHGMTPYQSNRCLNENNQSLYLIGEVIAHSRLEQKYTQSTLSEGICETETLSRVECGMQNISAEKYLALMKKMHKSWEFYRGILETEEYELLELAREIQRAFGDGNLEKTEELLVEISEKLDLTIPENIQYVEMIQNGLDGRTGKISISEMERRDICALKRTIPGWKEEVTYHEFTAVEIQLINHIAIARRIQGKKEEAVLMLRSIMEVSQKNKAWRFSHQKEIILIIGNICHNLSDLGEYEKALHYAEEGIALCMENQRGRSIIGLLIERAYDLEHMEDSDMLEKARQYYRQAFYLSDLLKTVENHRRIQEYYEEHFGQEQWY